MPPYISRLCCPSSGALFTSTGESSSFIGHPGIWDALSSGADRQRYLQLLSDNLYTLPCGQLRMELNVHVRLWSHTRVLLYSPKSARAL
jgi:hypothetical protein